MRFAQVAASVVSSKNNRAIQPVATDMRPGCPRRNTRIQSLLVPVSVRVDQSIPNIGFLSLQLVGEDLRRCAAFCSVMSRKMSRPRVAVAVRPAFHGRKDSHISEMLLLVDKFMDSLNVVCTEHSARHRSRLRQALHLVRRLGINLR
jgi:hypothetical protein